MRIDSPAQRGHRAQARRAAFAASLPQQSHRVPGAWRFRELLLAEVEPR